MSSITHNSEQRDLKPDWLRASELMAGIVRAAEPHVPTWRMLDYAFGGLDDEIMKALYGEHLELCPTCKEGMLHYGAQRPSDPARFFEVPELTHASYRKETYTLCPGDAGERLREFIAESSGPLLIVAGEANPAVYDPQLGAVLRRRARAADNGGEPLPRVICGPAMGLNATVKTPGETVLPKLAEEGLIELYQARRRQAFHFRVADGKEVYAEEYHRAGNPADRRGYWYTSGPIARLLERRFEALLEAGLAQRARREDFVFLEMETIRTIEKEKAETGGSFDRMTAEALASFQRRAGRDRASGHTRR